MTEDLLSDPKRKLHALLERLSACVATAPKGVCDQVFRDVAKFTQTALAERNRRLNRGKPERVLLLHVPVPKRAREEDKDEGAAATKFCSACAKAYTNEQLCDGCNSGFRWCCAGYSREPCEDPLYPSTGAKIMLQSFCGACLAARELSADCVLQQEEEYLRILEVFSRPDCRWKWISCLYDGWSIFSAAWTALEGLLFLLSPFYCQIGTQCDDVGSRDNPKFHEFVKECAGEALQLLGPDSGSRGEAWQLLRARPDQAPKFGDADFDLAWRAVANCLNAATPTRICIWQCRSEGLECAERYGCSELFEVAQPRVIDVLKWNGGVATHFDLMIAVEDALPEFTNFGVDDYEN